ncbi:MAG: hypothetical protein NT023_13130 [Armatimonadetes bacterium]|nr:hypothetical protein [Armatimonadota bacterium]
MADCDSLSDFIKVGQQRLKDAEELMEKPTADFQRSDAERRHLRGAMYLAGYAVECLLKAYLIDQEGGLSLIETQSKINIRRQSSGQELIRQIAATSAGHDIAYLAGLTDISVRPGYDYKVWSRLARWKSTWRYDYTTPKREEAEKFLQDVHTAVDWLQPNIIGY